MSEMKSKIFGITLAILLQVTALPVFAQTLDRFYENSSGAPHLQMINSAKSTLEMEVYTVKDSKIFQALEAAMNRGVKLRIVQEPTPFGDACQVFTASSANDDAKCVEAKNFVKFVRSHGGTYVPFDKGLCGSGGGICFQHGKVMISDSNLLLLSTGNFNPSNLCDEAEKPALCNRDYTVVTRDPVVVKSVQSLVISDIEDRAVDVRGVVSTARGRITASPFSLDPLVRFIDSAKKTIQIENQYLKDPTMNAALVRAAKRGVKVFIMVSSACSFGRPDQSAMDTWTRIYSEFDAAGIHTKTFNASIGVAGHAGYLHAKAILVDSLFAWVGSVNGSTTSLTMNREYGIFSNDPAFVRALGTILYSDYAEKNAETWQQSLQCKKDNAHPSDSDGNGNGN